jgi:tetratricopeptide (TPR) repeat protein
MALKLNKIAALGKGLKIDVSKDGVSINGKFKKIKLKVDKKGISASGSIPGTGINLSHTIPLPALKKKARLEVITKGSSGSLLAREFPEELRSKYYYFQSMLGAAGILLIAIAFKYPYALLAGIACIYGKGLWRKATDPYLHHYKNAFKNFKAKKYKLCAEDLKIVLQAPGINKDLMLVLAECYLELESFDMAFKTYREFFTSEGIKASDEIQYISAVMNAALLFAERDESQLLLKLAEALPDETVDRVEYKPWKHYFRGVAFMSQGNYQVAIDAFKNAVGKRQKMEEPYIDCHYQIAICYYLLGKTSLAKQSIHRVYSFNTGYKNTRAIYERLNKGEKIDELI